ncbi:hypothetical protein Taro_046358 [Colocasia esculenta]|uniref:Uncharacterized protein n=1 Tax=Colocasia esculenta TaxID=4460 RepID=A0A843WPP1_COLES|nr:hypothetical protein [Colocasia esculenta]
MAITRAQVEASNLIEAGSFTFLRTSSLISLARLWPGRERRTRVRHVIGLTGLNNEGHHRFDALAVEEEDALQSDQEVLPQVSAEEVVPLIHVSICDRDHVISPDVHATIPQVHDTECNGGDVHGIPHTSGTKNLILPLAEQLCPPGDMLPQKQMALNYNPEIASCSEECTLANED